MTKSATAMVLERLPKVLDDQGKTFWQIWDLLVQDKALAPMLFNDKEQPRYGVLQGISTRIKADKVPGLSIARVNGESMWFATDDELDIWLRQVELAVSQVNSLPLPPNIKDKSQKELVVKLSTMFKTGEEQVSKLKDSVSKAAKVKVNALTKSNQQVKAPKTPTNKPAQDKNNKTDKSKQVADAKDKTETKPGEATQPAPAK